MTKRERLLKIFNNERPDVVPWFGDLDYYASALITKREKPEDFKISDDYLEWHRNLGVGFYLQGYFPFRTIYKNCEEKNYTDGNLRYREFITPKGNIRECYEYLPLSFTEAHIEHFIKNDKDLDMLSFVYNDAEYLPDYKQAEIRKRQTKDDGIVLVYAPKTPFMQLLVYDAGIMNLSELLIDSTDKVEETLEAMKHSFDKALDIVLKCPADAIMIPENLSSELVGKRYFEQYMKPAQVEWINKIKEASKYSFIHMDGSLRGLLKEECSTGIDVLEALTPSPVGDVEFKDLADFASGNKTILWGGLPGSYFTSMVSEQEFERHIKEVLNIMTKEPRYVLGVADQVPPDALESRIKRVSELVEMYGKFE